MTRQSGQATVEYILALVILVAIATIIGKGLVGRSDSQGMIFKVWGGVGKAIGEDIPEHVE